MQRQKIPDGQEARTTDLSEREQSATHLTVDPLVGSVLSDRYEILEKIASGGMGSVYRARDRELDEIVALKLLRNDLRAGGYAASLFRQEVKWARRVTHRNVARTYELGSHKGQDYLTMEYVEGESLSALLRRQQRISTSLCVYILCAVCEGLDAAHSVSVIHRDIKPDNILVASDSRVVITDFGLAQSGPIGSAKLSLGTPAYMAPEQMEGAELTPSTDVYSLGITGFELITGKKPFAGESLAAIAAARLTDKVPDPRDFAPDVPDCFAEAIMRCMQRDPKNRFASVMDAARAFALASTDTQVVPLSPNIQPNRPSPASHLIAVMPFRTREDLGDEYVIDGLVDDIVDSLSTMKGLRVMSRTAAQKLWGPSSETRAIGGNFGLSAVVEGSARKLEGEFLISLRLIRVSDGVQIWAKRYVCKKEQILGITDEIAREISLALAVEPNRPVRIATADSQAIELYLRAKQAYARFTFDELLTAIDLFEQARLRVPDDPMICSGLAMALARRWFYDFAGTREWFWRAKETAETALQSAPWMGEPHLAIGTILLHSGEPVAATKSFRTAIGRSPSLAEGHEMLGRILSEAGHLSDAKRRLETAQSLDPWSSVALWEFVRTAALEGDWEQFRGLLAKTLTSDKKRSGRWTNYLRFAAWQRDSDCLQDITKEFEQARKESSFDFGAVDAFIDVVVRKGSAQSAYAAMESRAFLPGASARRATFYLQMEAELAGFVGDRETCIKALENADRRALLDLHWLNRCPLLEIARDGAEYRAVRESLKSRADQVLDALWG